MWQGIIVGVLVLAAAAYVAWALVPAVKRRWRRSVKQAEKGDCGCGGPGACH